ncbi:SurA N-terminal domain-containing protein [Defluviimonas sp. D31]|uniref:peptidylprolyl isomerase n=1 Tax=Defluviimonas sp. D31 TaxID=3083253 RepID=UPI00296ED217|nr:peptidyl-prolyl cis-trans isomerase [Defluviimonas sp. D31]MDW4548943.1 SurA N-terminal domain-containing protein [Defluviimonas sp. D31]
MSNPLRSKKRGNTIIWILMAMLILGLGGFGARNFGGSVRTIGTVGEREVDLRDYARMLNREIAAVSAQLGQPVNFAQAQSLGIDRSVMARVIASAALDNEADRIGLSVGDGEVRKHILGIEAFQGIDGTFDRDAYTLVLKQEGLGEAEFESKLRDETARTLLQGAILGGTAAPEAAVNRTAAWLTETRNFTLAELAASDLAEPVPAPTEAEIKAYYDAHPEAFTRPETRRISYVWLSPEMLEGKVELDEDALRASYQERIDEFVTPERRLVERLVYPNEEAAEAAKARFEAGEVTFEDLARERGLTLPDTDLGEMSEAALGAAGAPVFALEEPGVVGPLPSDLGPALYAMNGILEAQEVTFEEARPDLATEASADRARRMIADRTDAIEDLLASGATLEEVADETEMELGEVAFDATTEDGIAAYSAFRDAAQAATDADFPTLTALDDGGVFALRLDGIDAPALRPLDEVRDAAAEAWTRDETHKRLVARADEVKAELEAGKALEATGLVTTRYEDFARGGFLSGAPADVAEQAFTLAEGEAAVVETPETVHVVALTGITAAAADGPELTRARDALEVQFGQSLAQDMFELFTEALQAEAGIRIDQAAVNAVHAQLN